MTNIVSLNGMFAPVQGGRDAKANDDNVLASFAGVLAGVNQANAKLIVPMPQADGASGGEALENTEDGNTTSDAKSTDAKDVSTIIVGQAVDAGSPAVVSVTNPNAVNSSIAALNPALQQKLARVMERMRDETGHDVQVAETYRSQSRQNSLYAQGRQTDGPVVTWTQHSKHTQGRAVDVILDGGRASADAYTTLQRIANEEGLRTLGAKDPGHLELSSKSAATSQALNDVISVPEEPADASGPGQVSVGRLAQIAQIATVEEVTSVGSSGSAHTAKLSPTTYMKAAKASDAPAHVAQVANVAQVATVANAAGGSTPRRVHVTTANGGAHLDAGKHAKQQVASAQADGAADMPIAPQKDTGVAEEIIARNAITIADATGASSDDSPNTLKISNLEQLNDAVNATRVEDGSTQTPTDANKPRLSPNAAAYTKSHMTPRAEVYGSARFAAGEPRATQATTKPQNGATHFPAASIGRSPSNNQGFSGDSQSNDRDTTGYNAMTLRAETASQFSVADVSTEMTSTASQRAERIMAAQDAPARPLSQIVMSVDNGNGTSDRIQVALRGSTVNATIDAADHHAANVLRAHSDELVRSLTKDGVDVESVRVRNTATTTAAAQVTTVDSSQKSSDTSSNSRFNRGAQWDQQRSQQRSNGERRQQQRDQRRGQES
jgi:uncharacterized protein YcbK (DUF882 family)